LRRSPLHVQMGFRSRLSGIRLMSNREFGDLFTNTLGDFALDMDERRVFVMTQLSLSIPDPLPLDGLLSLQGRCAVVTGGSRGIGEAIVRRLVEAGAAVVFTGRGREALQRVEAQVAAAGGKAVGVQADVSRIEDSRRVINLAVERFGRVDILVNNAAVFPGSLAMEMTEAV
jgi:hypothetical protein